MITHARWRFGVPPVPEERTDEQASPPVEQFRQRWCIVDGCYQRKAVGDYCQLVIVRPWFSSTGIGTILTYG